MIESILFISSGTIVFWVLVKVTSVAAGNEVRTPAPILHLFEVGFSNTYISTSAIAYQVYFWASYHGFIGG